MFEKKDAEPKGGPEGTPLAGALRVKISQLVLDPDQPRRAVGGEDGAERLEALAGSIKTYGILAPLVVRREGAKNGLPQYRVIAGHRRLAAAAMAGQETLPVIVRQDAPKDIFLLQLVENLHREDLSPLDEGLAYKLLLDRDGLTARDLGRRLGVSDQRIRDRVRVVLHPATADALRESRIPYVLAREILKAVPAVRDHLCARREAGDSLTQADLITANAKPDPSVPTGADDAGRVDPIPAIRGASSVADDPYDDPLEEYLGRERSGGAPGSWTGPRALPAPPPAQIEATAPTPWVLGAPPPPAFAAEAFLVSEDRVPDPPADDAPDDDAFNLDALASALDRAAALTAPSENRGADRAPSPTSPFRWDDPSAGQTFDDALDCDRDRQGGPAATHASGAFPLGSESAAGTEGRSPGRPRAATDERSNPGTHGEPSPILPAQDDPGPTRIPAPRPHHAGHAIPPRSRTISAGDERPPAPRSGALIDLLEALPAPTLTMLSRVLRQARQAGIDLEGLNHLCDRALGQHAVPDDQQPI